MPIPGGMTRPVEGSANPEVTGSGSFIIGTSAVFYFTFVNLRGLHYDPSAFSIEIFDPDGVSIGTDEYLDKIITGEFAYVWAIPTTSASGAYTLTLTYTVETASGPVDETHTESFVITKRGAGGLTFKRITYRAFLESLIGYIQRIPVWHEIIRFDDKARTRGYLSFPRWNQSAGARIWLNGELLESGHTIDYVNGRVTFEHDISAEDELICNYNFRWFSDLELDDFIEHGINMTNMWPPQQGWNINNIPVPWILTAEIAAAVFVLQRWMLDILFQEPSKIFGGLDRANEIFNHMNELKKNYEDQLDKMLSQKKNFPYLGVTKTVTIPEFTLPGGRCISEDSLVTYLLDDKEVTSTVADLYEVSSSKHVRILSDQDGELVFADMTRIWESGTKSLLQIMDNQDNKIEVSEDHIIFVDDKEIPASKVSIGDVLTIVVNKKIQHSLVSSINPSRMALTFDIEVPSTKNLFVNNVKCHNSRWFRYLFKGAVIFFPLLLML